MLSWVRSLLENWVVRVLMGLLILVSIFWGISNVLTLAGGNSTVAHIGGKAIDVALVQTDYQARLDQFHQQNQVAPDAPTRQQLAGAALSAVLRTQALQMEEKSLGLGAPPAAIRQAVFALPAFQTNGVFDQAKFTATLAANNKTPSDYLADVRASILGQQLVLPLIAAATPPKALVDQVFAFVAEQRIAETVDVPVAGQQLPPAPNVAVLQRYWRNHQALFAAPETREVKIVLLSPALLAPRESVSDADLAAAYARVTAGQVAVPLRSVQVITMTDQGKAAALAQRWAGGADWTQMQALATQQGGNPVALDHAKQVEIPSAPLAAAVFAATPGAVTGPVQGPFGYFVFKVTDTGSSLPGAEQIRGQLRAALQLQQAQAQVAQDVDNVQDALAGQTPLDKLPGNLDLVAVQGTLDANGNAADGTPAPIPGGAALKAAVVKSAFAAHVNDPAQLTDGPDGSYFAVTVDSITPQSIRPFSDVADQVDATWTQDALVHAAETKAAALLAAVDAGQSLDTAAAAGGYATTMSAPVTRNAAPNGMTSQMEQILFSLQPGQATMLQTDQGFTVAALAKIHQPSASEDPNDYAQVQASLLKSMQDDLAQSFIAGLQGRDKVTINQPLFAQIYQ